MYGASKNMNSVHRCTRNFTVSPCILYHNCLTHTNSCTRFKLY